jgi:hypothetical protein
LLQRRQQGMHADSVPVAAGHTEQPVAFARWPGAAGVAGTSTKAGEG